MEEVGVCGVNLIKVLLVVFYLFLVGVLSSVGKVRSIPGPLFRGAQSRVFSVTVFSMNLVVVSVFLEGGGGWGERQFLMVAGDHYLFFSLGGRCILRLWFG